MADLPQMTILADSCEQKPYDFATLKSDHVRHEVETVRLPEGDYTIRDGETCPAHKIVIERKSLADLYGSLGKTRARFEREFERLSHYGYAALVIEASFAMILNPNQYMKRSTGMYPSAALGTLLA